jgi:insertion element IS1 protein InsB
MIFAFTIVDDGEDVDIRLMKTTSSEQTCPHCKGKEFRKNGVRNGHQCYQCKDCGHQTTFRRPYKKVSAMDKERIRRGLRERVSLRALANIFGVSLSWLYQFACKVFREKGFKLSKSLQKLIRNADEEFEIDELCTYVGNKKQKAWVWIAIHRRSKQIIAFQVGKRNKATFKKLWNKLLKLGINGKIYTDRYPVYAAIIPTNQHICEQKRGQTNNIERFNGTLRAKCSRLVRNTYSFAKSFKNLVLSIRYFIIYYNISLQ